MDPNATFKRILELLAESEADQAEAYHACKDLIGWIDRGGFLPLTGLDITCKVWHGALIVIADLLEGQVDVS